jgi:peptidoglycan/LPS O-acetylase OafA/YrhL
MSDRSKADSYKHEASLDGFRGLAILLVFARHYLISSHLKSTAATFVMGLGAGGWMGVDLFFVLSGFLITGILDASVSRPSYFRDFYIRRSLRILPLFYGVFCLLLVLTNPLRLQWRWGHLSYLVYLQNIAVNIDPSLNTIVPSVNLEHFWSLAVEEQFYIVWPLTIWLVRDRRTMMRLCLAGILAGILLRLTLVICFPGSVIDEWIYKELPTHMDGLLAGAYVALAIRETSILAVLRRTRAVYYSAIAVLIIVFVTGRTLDFHSVQMAIAGYTATALVFSGLLLRTLLLGTVPNRIFSGSFLRFCGRYSYGIYVYHVLFGPVLLTLMAWLQDRLESRIIGGFLFVVISFLLSVAAAVISYEFFEARFLKLKNRLAPPVRAAQGAAA